MTSCIATPRSLLSELEHLPERDRDRIMEFAHREQDLQRLLDEWRNEWDRWCNANGDRISNQLRRNHK